MLSLTHKVFWSFSCQYFKIPVRTVNDFKLRDLKVKNAIIRHHASYGRNSLSVTKGSSMNILEKQIMNPFTLVGESYIKSELDNDFISGPNYVHVTVMMVTNLDIEQ